MKNFGQWLHVPHAVRRIFTEIFLVNSNSTITRKDHKTENLLVSSLLSPVVQKPTRINPIQRRRSIVRFAVQKGSIGRRLNRSSLSQ